MRATVIKRMRETMVGRGGISESRARTEGKKKVRKRE